MTIEVANGVVADRTLQCLANCDDETLTRLYKDGDFYVKGGSSFDVSRLGPCNLNINRFDRYAEVADTSVSFLLFGEDVPPEPRYTPIDKDIIAILNRMPTKRLRAVKEGILDFFPSRFHRLPDDAHQRLMEFFDANKYTIASNPDFFSFRRYDNDVFEAELERMKRRGYDLRFQFTLDSYPTVAAYLGASLHWVLSLNSPLYCETQAAEEVFDLFTIMRPAQWSEFCRLLLFVKDADMYEAMTSPFHETGGRLL